MKKILIVFLATFIFVFSSLIYPQEKAKAFVPVAAAGGAAVGGYVIGALAVSAIALHIGRELNNDELIAVGDAVKIHSDLVYAKSSQAAKDAWQSMYQSSLTTNEALSLLPDILASALTEDVSSVTLAALSAMKEASGAVEPQYALGTIKIGEVGYSKQANLHAWGWVVTFQKGGEIYYGDYLTLSWQGGMDVIIQGRQLMQQELYDAGVNSLGSSSTSYNAGRTTNLAYETYTNATTFAGVAGAVAGVIGLNYYPRELWEQTQDVREQIERDIPRMLDAGLVVPVRDFETTKTGAGAGTAAGEAVNYDGQTGTYVDERGVPYTGDIAIDVPVPNVYIPRDSTGVAYGNPSISIPYVGTPVDVFTGSPTIETDIPSGGGGGTGGGDGTGGGTTPKKITFAPLVVAGLALSGKFPFSIPWDVFGLFSVFDVEPDTPKFEINSGDGINLGGKNILVNYKFDIDFGIFDTLAKISRWALVLIFDIALIMGLRRLTPD